MRILVTGGAGFHRLARGRRASWRRGPRRVGGGQPRHRGRAAGSTRGAAPRGRPPERAARRGVRGGAAGGGGAPRRAGRGGPLRGRPRLRRQRQRDGRPQPARVLPAGRRAPLIYSSSGGAGYGDTDVDPHAGGASEPARLAVRDHQGRDGALRRAPGRRSTASAASRSATPTSTGRARTPRARRASSPSSAIASCTGQPPIDQRRRRADAGLRLRRGRGRRERRAPSSGPRSPAASTSAPASRPPSTTSTAVSRRAGRRARRRPSTAPARPGEQRRSCLDPGAGRPAPRLAPGGLARRGAGPHLRVLQEGAHDHDRRGAQAPSWPARRARASSCSRRPASSARPARRPIPIRDGIPVMLISEAEPWAPGRVTAVILAGGQGTRLRPAHPRPAQADRAAAQRPVPRLPARPAPRGTASATWSSPAPTWSTRCGAAMGDGAALRACGCRYAVEAEPLGTAGGVRNAADLVRGLVVVLNGDILTDVDLSAPCCASTAERGAAATHLPDAGRRSHAPTGSSSSGDGGRIRALRREAGSRRRSPPTPSTPGVYAPRPRAPRPHPDRPRGVDRARVLPRRSSPTGIPFYGWVAGRLLARHRQPRQVPPGPARPPRRACREPRARPPARRPTARRASARADAGRDAWTRPCVIGARLPPRRRARAWAPHAVLGAGCVVGAGRGRRAARCSGTTWRSAPARALRDCIVGAGVRIGARAQVGAGRGRSRPAPSCPTARTCGLSRRAPRRTARRT